MGCSNPVFGEELIILDGGSTFFGKKSVFAGVTNKNGRRKYLFWQKSCIFLGGVTYYNGRRKYFFSDRNPVFEVGSLIIMNGGSTFLAEILKFLLIKAET